MAKHGGNEQAEAPEPRKGMPDVHLDEPEFRKRFLQQFADPRFEEHGEALDAIEYGFDTQASLFDARTGERI